MYGDLGLLNKVFKALLTTNEHDEMMFLYRCDGRRWRCHIFISADDVLKAGVTMTQSSTARKPMLFVANHDREPLIVTESG